MKMILVVDDDSRVRLLAKMILQQAGYLVEEAGDGKEALDVLGRWTPDVMLTDIVMPRKEGIQLILEVRQQYPQVCIIAMSGGDVLHPGLYLESAKQFGATRVIYKPNLVDELLQAVNDICMGRKQEPEE